MKNLPVLLLLLLLSACSPLSPDKSPTLALPTPQTPVPGLSPSKSPPPLSLPTNLPSPLPPVPSPSPSPAPLSPSFPSPKFQFSYTPWEPVLAQAWSPDGSLLAVAAGTKVHLYESQEFNLLRTIQLDAWVGGMDFYPGPGTDRFILALVLKNGMLELWDAVSSDLICAVQAHPRSGNSLAFVPGGSVLATAGSDPMVRLWELQPLIEENSCELEPHAELIGSSFAVPYVQFDPLGVELASVDGRAVRMREVATERLAGVLQGEDSIFSIDYKSTGDILAVAEIGEKVRLWDAREHVEIGLLTVPEPQPNHFIWQVAFSPDGRFVAGGSSSGKLYFWETGEAKTWAEPLIFEAGTRDICSISFNLDGSLLFSGSLDGVFTAWSLPE